MDLPSAELANGMVPAMVMVTGSVILRQAAILSSVGQFTFRAIWGAERVNTRTQSIHFSENNFVQNLIGNDAV